MRSEFSNSELRRLDLTLLLVFLGLVKHRKAMRVAAELGLTPSAISQALKRLRDVFSDDLFLRRPHGLEPTAMAIALEQPVAQAVAALRGAVGAARAFDPGEAEGLVRIAALDAEQAVIVPPLASRLRKMAPGLRLSILPLGRAAAVEALADGRADMLLGVLWDDSAALSSECLYEEGFLVAGLASALPDAPCVTLDHYCAAGHILISPAGDMRGVVDTALESMGRRRDVSLALPAFLPALAAAAQSGAIVTLPARLARAFAPGFGLVIAEPPLEVRRFRISAYWHRRNDDDPRTRWLRHVLTGLHA